MDVNPCLLEYRELDCRCFTASPGRATNSPRMPPFRPHPLPFAAALAALLAWGCASGPRGETGHAAVPQPVAHADLGHGHIPNPDFPHEPYNSNPASSGPHTPYIARWGLHDKSVREEVAVHNLEHGGIVIGYRCRDCPDLVRDLAAYAEAYPMVVVAPNPRLDAPIVFAAWAHTLAVERLDAAARRAVNDFFAAHYGVDHHVGGGHHTAPDGPPASP